MKKKDATSEISHVPQILYKGKKTEDEIRRKTIATPFQPVVEFGRAKKNDWVNKLIWGDNAQALKYLIENGYKEKINLIYIDPPFATKSDFDKNGEVKAYRDKLAGAEFIEFIRERLVLLKDLLAPTGGIYVHLDSKMNSYIRVVMDEIFGKEHFKNEIIWCYTGPSNTKKWFPRKHDIVLWYSKTKEWKFNCESIKIPYKKLDTGNTSGIFKQSAKLDKSGKIPESWWSDITTVGRIKHEPTGYPTQKPEKLLERIIKASSDEGDIVLDCFCGSGTTCAVAEKLGRKWIGIDAGKIAIYTTQKRILDLPNGRKPFTRYNSGIYEMSKLVSNKDFKINEKSYKKFAADLFGIDTTKAKKEKGVQYDGVGRGNINTIIMKPTGFIERSNLQELAKHIGKGKVYVVFAKNQDRVMVDNTEIDGVKFYLHKIPYSLIELFIIDGGNSDDVSAITRNLKDIVMRKVDGGIDNKAIEKIGKIAQPKSRREIEQKFTNIAGFDFVDTTKFAINTKIKKNKGKVVIELVDFKTPQYQGVQKLSLILVDNAFNGRVLKPTHIFWAENYVEEEQNGNEVLGFLKNYSIEFPTTKKPIAIAYIDDFGNEVLEQIDI